MNFKEQMQEKAEEYVRSMYIQTVLPDAVHCKTDFLAGAPAALSSDLVKGLVEALERLAWAYPHKNDLPYINAKTALTNYKQEVK